MTRKRVLKQNELSPADLAALRDIVTGLNHYLTYYNAFTNSINIKQSINYEQLISALQIFIREAVFHSNRYAFSQLNQLNFNLERILFTSESVVGLKCNVFHAFLSQSLFSIQSIKNHYLSFYAENV